MYVRMYVCMHVYSSVKRQGYFGRFWNIRGPFLQFTQTQNCVDLLVLCLFVISWHPATTFNGTHHHHRLPHCHVFTLGALAHRAPDPSMRQGDSFTGKQLCFPTRIAVLQSRSDLTRFSFFLSFLIVVLLSACLSQLPSFKLISFFLYSRSSCSTPPAAAT